MKAIKTTVYNSNQSWYFDEIRRLPNSQMSMVHIMIRKNAYDAQSYGKIELWTGTAWSLIHSIPGEVLDTSCSYTEKNVTASRFAEDVKDLVDTALEVLA